MSFSPVRSVPAIHDFEKTKTTSAAFHVFPAALTVDVVDPDALLLGPAEARQCGHVETPVGASVRPGRFPGRFQGDLGVERNGF